ncbi:MAG: SiaB family protein kinase [Bacteroidota bacterium]
MEIDTIQKKELYTIFKLYNIMQKNYLNCIYRGIFTNEFTKKILSLTETSLIEKEEPRILKKKIYNIMVEGLQNITRHQADNKIESNNNYSVFALKREFGKYFITIGNLVEKKLVEELSLKIENVNKLSKEQLKEYYTKGLLHDKISERGGAGLGLIDMARKSGNKLLYSFEEIDDIYSYFYMHTEILANKKIEPDFDTKFSKNTNYNNTLHKILNEENVIFSFNNSFNEDNMMNLLSVIENQVKDNVKLKKRVYNIMVEMFQNIIKHGYDYENVYNSESGGLFYISENNDAYMLNTGNYIKSQKIKKLRDKIDYINSLSANELENFYNDMLFNFDIDSNKEAGLGLIDLRMRTDSQLKYEFLNIDDEFSFYALRTTISKK